MLKEPGQCALTAKLYCTNLLSPAESLAIFASVVATTGSDKALTTSGCLIGVSDSICIFAL